MAVDVGMDARGRVFILSPGGELIIHVADGRGRPIAGAEAEIVNERAGNIADDLVPDSYWRSPRPYLSLFSGSDGSITLSHLAPGAYRVAARKGNARTNEVEVLVAEGQSAVARLALSDDR